ncbi:hypothetical protein AgCh_005032 [Apium graveolens]
MCEEATEIGKAVNALRKHASKEIRNLAKSLIEYEYLFNLRQPSLHTLLASLKRDYLISNNGDQKRTKAAAGRNETEGGTIAGKLNTGGTGIGEKDRGKKKEGGEEIQKSRVMECERWRAAREID